MVRASHTLCGIHRTGGFPLIASTAKSLEQALLALQQREPPLPGPALPVLARAVEGLRVLVGHVRDRTGFGIADAKEAGEIQAELDALRQESMAEPTLADAESQAEDQAARDEHAEAQRTAVRVAMPERRLAAERGIRLRPRCGRRRSWNASPRSSPRSTSAAAVDPLADIRDDVDQDVLPIFLEEAAELFPQAGEQLRAWRRARPTRQARVSCGGRCTRSRAARGWPARCASASSRT